MKKQGCPGRASARPLCSAAKAWQKLRRRFHGFSRQTQRCDLSFHDQRGRASDVVARSAFARVYCCVDLSDCPPHLLVRSLVIHTHSDSIR